MKIAKKKILGIGVTNALPADILEYIILSLQKRGKPYYVVTPNPEMVMLASKHAEFRSILNHAEIATNDGVGIGLAAKILGISLAPRLTGVDLLERLCAKIANRPITVGFLGAKRGVAEKAAKCLQKKYPGLKVVFASDIWPGDEAGLTVGKARGGGKSEKSGKAIEKSLKGEMIHLDILFVAFGAPKQELWMAAHVGKIPATVMVGVGGSFDYLSGMVPRAPRLIRKVGLEWLFRLVRQPWRFTRQLALLEFIGMVLKEKLSTN